MSDIAVQVENLSKMYHLGTSKTADLRETIANIFRKSVGGQSTGEVDFWALKDVGFEVPVGNVMGIIGKNGAGKSTLLKILSRITEPTSGRIKIKGRVSSLLEVGTGFHPELTGRENVYMNGSILGMTQREINQKFDEIVEFSGIEKFIDTPVKRYSSGMYVRLAFSVAAHLEPEVLIVDEVLSVGDYEFQKRCIGKMKDVSGKGRTVLFVSHNMGAVSELCSSAMMLHQGKIMTTGTADEVIRDYVNSSFKESNVVLEGGDQFKNFKVTNVEMVNQRGDRATMFDILEDFYIKVRVQVIQQMEELRINMIVNKDFKALFFTRLTDDVEDTWTFEPGEYEFTYKVSGKRLKAGAYTASIIVTYPGGKLGEMEKAELENVAKFELSELSINTDKIGYAGKRPGTIIAPGEWSINKA